LFSWFVLFLSFVKVVSYLFVNCSHLQLHLKKTISTKLVKMDIWYSEVFKFYK
jgi:hypothetical protein